MSEIICKGCIALKTNCGKCSKCYVEAQSELAALREELASREVLEAQTAVTGWAAKYRAAEQRNAELERDAARYRWLRDKSESIHQFYLSTPIWCTGVKFNQESVDNAIDAALKPTESGASE